jgi:hypothetical protein
MVVELNQTAREAPLEVKDDLGARNRRMAYRVVRFMCDYDRLKSDGVNPAPPVRWCSVCGLRELHWAPGKLAEGWVGAEEGWSGRSTVAGARAAASTPCAGRMPVNSCSGWVGSERRCTVEAGVGFIVAGVGLARRGARGRGTEHRGVLWRC